MDSRGIQTLEELQEKLPMDTVLYTTMEPCIKRLSGNKSCVDRIVEAKRIRKVYVGVLEPEKFVEENNGRRVLETAGIQYAHLPGLEHEILEVATAGHEKTGGS
jgi:pyrimidine deaminase RibD-like protein